MATKQELYISLDPQEYKQGKTQILNAELEVITNIRHAKTMKKLAAQKRVLKLRLHKLFENLANSTDFIESHMPTPSIPKSLQNALTPSQTPKIVVSRESLSQTAKQAAQEAEPKMDSEDRRLDYELQEIQAKLRMLNR